MFLTHTSYEVHVLQEDAGREEKAKGSYQRADKDDNRSRIYHTPSHSPTLLITSLRHAWQWRARRIQVFLREKALTCVLF